MKFTTIGIIFFSLAAIAGITAIVISAGVHGLQAASGLDGEYDFRPEGWHGHHVTEEGVEVAHSPRDRWRGHHDTHVPDACYGPHEGVGHDGDWQDRKYCPSNIDGEFNFTLSIWLFVWGIGTTVVALLAGIMGCFSVAGGFGMFLEIVTAIVAFFAWVPWGIVGLVMLMRSRDHSIGGSSADAVYGMSIAAMVIISLVWFLVGVLATVVISDAAKTSGLLIKQSQGHQLSASEMAALDEFVAATAPVDTKKGGYTLVR